MIRRREIYNRKKTRGTRNNKYTNEVLLNESFYKHFESHIDKDYATADHACSCMLRAVVFPAELYHASIPPCRGARICLQLQFKRVKGHIYPHKYARTYDAGIVMSDKDELYLFLKHQVEFQHYTCVGWVRFGRSVRRVDFPTLVRTCPSWDYQISCQKKVNTFCHVFAHDAINS